jgi:hypothetical protein
MATKFCKVEDVHAVMQSEESFTRDNNLIALYIEQSSALIRQYTRREWDMGEYTDYLDTHDIDVAINKGKGAYIVTLREKPVVVTEDFYPKIRYSVSGNWDDYADADRQQYSCDPRKSQIILYPGLMTSHPRALRVVYRAGYSLIPNTDDVVDVPSNIKSACIAQAAFYVRRALNNVSGTSRKDSQERMASYGVTKTGLVSEALALLRTEVRLFVGGNA